MKSTGIVRKIDELGRIVIPIELRRELGILSYKEKGSDKKSDSDAVEIYTEGENIILRKYQSACIFCGEAKNIVNYKGKNICSRCKKDLGGAK